MTAIIVTAAHLQIQSAIFSLFFHYQFKSRERINAIFDVNAKKKEFFLNILMSSAELLDFFFNSTNCKLHNIQSSSRNKAKKIAIKFAIKTTKCGVQLKYERKKQKNSTFIYLRLHVGDADFFFCIFVFFSHFQP